MSRLPDGMKRVSESLDKKLDFRSRRYKRADDNVRAGDFSKAMQALEARTI